MRSKLGKDLEVVAEPEEALEAEVRGVPRVPRRDSVGVDRVVRVP